MWGKNGESGGRIVVVGPSKNLCQGWGSLAGGWEKCGDLMCSRVQRGKIR